MTEAKPDTRIAGLEKTLTDLQNRHRLAIHVWEPLARETFCEKTLQAFEAIPSDGLYAAVAEQTHPLVSLSLLPSEGIAMRPYMATYNQLPRPGYLVDLDQQRKIAAPVVRAHENLLASGDETKKLSLPVRGASKGIFRSAIKALDAVYYPYDGDQNRWYQQFENEHDSRALSAEQLDLLGTAYTQDKPLRYHMDHHGLRMVNEIIAAPAREHIAAIALPLVYDENMPPSYHDVAQLFGALCGLSHAARGVDLPVVYYDASGKQPGALQWLGQGKAELTQKALEALQNLQQWETPNCDNLKEALLRHGYYDRVGEILHAPVQELLGVDISQPLSGQIRALSHVQTLADHQANSDITRGRA